MKKILISVLALFVSFGWSADTLQANYSGGNGRGGITEISNPQGTIDSVEFNRFTDSRYLVALRGRGFYEVDLPAGNDRCMTVPPTGVGIPNPPNPFQNSNQLAGYPFFDPTCVQSYVETVEAGASSHLDERDFSSARLCAVGGCGTLTAEPALTNLGTCSATSTAGCLQRSAAPARLPYWEHFGQYGPQYDFWYRVAEQPEGQLFYQRNYGALSDYEHEVLNLRENDQVRVFVYLHNNAREVEQTSADFSALQALNTTVEIDWSTITSLQSTINADNAAAITDATTLSFTDPALGLEPVGATALERIGTTDTLIPFTYTAGATDLSIPIGNVASSYGNVELVYIDFNVVRLPEVFTLTKSTLSADGTTMIPDAGNLTIGQTYRYQVTMTNTGTIATTTRTVTDQLDTNLTFVSNLDDTQIVENPAASGTIELTFDPIPAGGSLTKEFQVLVNASTPDGTQICNTATDLPTAVISNQVCQFAQTAATEIFTLVKSAFRQDGITPIADGTGIIAPSETYRYQVTMTNTGTIATTTRTVTDQLDTNLTFVSNLGDTQIVENPAASGTIELTFDPIPAGGSLTKIFEVQVAVATPDATVICNTATDIPLAISSVQICLTVSTTPVEQFTLTKDILDLTNTPVVAGTNLIIGQPLRYRVTLTNTGTIDTIPRTVTDQLDANLVFVSNLGDLTIVENPAASGTIEMAFAAVTPGNSAEKIFEVRVIDTASNNTQVCNEAIDPISTLTTVPVCEFTACPNFGLALLATPVSGSTVQRGLVYSYELITINNETFDIPSLTVTMDLGSFITFESNRGDAEIVAPLAGNTIVTFNLANLAAGTSTSKIFDVRVINDAITVPDGSVISVVATQATCGITTTPATVHPVNGAVADAFVITKTATPIDGTPVNPGDSIEYQITVQNGGTQNIDSIIVTDALHSQLTFTGFVSAPGATFDLPSNTVTLDFNTITPGASVTQTFTVQVNPGATGQVTNRVTGAATINGIAVTAFSNLVTHPIPSTGSGGTLGGGGGDRNPTIGVCETLPNGAWRCVARYPEWNLNDPDYTAYRNCENDNTRTESECLNDWRVAKGFLGGCTEPGDVPPASLITAFQSTYGRDPSNEEMLAFECNPPVIGVVDSRRCETLGTPSVYLEKTRISAEKSAVGELVEYQIELQIDSSVNITDTATIESIRIYDYVVPSESGTLWDREHLSTPAGWTAHFDLGRSYFEKQFRNSAEKSNIMNAIQNGVYQETFRYTLDTTLFGEADLAENIKNTAFAVVEYTDSLGNRKSKRVVGRGNGNPLCPEVALHDTQGSFGSTALVSVVRPFVQAIGGGNIGFDTNEKVSADFANIGIDGANTSGKLFAKEGAGFGASDNLSGQERYTELGSDDYFQNLLINAVKDNKWNVFTKKSADNSGIYFFGNEYGNLTASQTGSIGRSETFIIDQGDFIIDKNLTFPGPYLPAFIVRNGDIIIDKNVTEIQGIFITEKGQIRPPVKTNTEYGRVFEESRNQLRVSGSLIGNAVPLLKNRKYIGKIQSSGSVKLDSSIKILYDLRLLENTPPGLQKFLGDGWAQSVR